MRLKLYLAALLLLSGCGPQSTRPGPEQDPETEVKQQLQAGNYVAAAEGYLRLAKLYPKYSVLYQLRATGTLLDAGEIEQARTLLDMTEPTGDTQNESAIRTLLMARLALLSGQAETALSLLGKRFSENIPHDLLATRHSIRAQAYAKLRNYINAAQERLRADEYIHDAHPKQQNIQALWYDLNSIKPELLKMLRANSNELMRSWVELALINQAHLFKPKLLQQALDSWKQQYPEHPAISMLLQEMQEVSEKHDLKPGHVAVLLPFAGQFQKAANAIRDGFLAAWYDSATYQPDIRFYDADALNILQRYQTAVNNGAGLIIGPLEKKAVQSLAESADISVTTLALNQVNVASRENTERLASEMPALIQFGLSPEDEAQQIAERAFADGHKNALVVTPEGDWGQRLYQAFVDRFEQLGGSVLEHVNYQSTSSDYRKPVKQMLNIDSSERRARLLKERLSRRLKSEGRLRQDADMLFMAAAPVSARQLVPQLRFFRADHVPVYTTSRAYSGSVNPQSDNDMNNVMFLDMPWLLKREQESSFLQETINHLWSADSSAYRRLYALGIDAFQLIPELARLSLQRHSSYAGKTGELSMSEDGRIRRKLLWARFVKGRPSLMQPQTVQEQLN